MTEPTAPNAVKQDPFVYDVRKRSPIKEEEAKYCPECGQLLPSTTKPLTNVMNHYISKSGNVVCVHSSDDTITMNGVTMYRCNGTNDEGKPISSILTKEIVIEADAAAVAAKAKANADTKAATNVKPTVPPTGVI